MLFWSCRPRPQSTISACFSLGQVSSEVSLPYEYSYAGSNAIVPFHEGYGATVHFHWPGKGFQLLGSYVLISTYGPSLLIIGFLARLTNDKPSAIFRLRGTFTSQASLAHLAFQGNVAAAADPANVTATLGISIEPLHAIQSQLATLPSALTKPARDPTADSAVLAEKIVKHLFNYLSSFTSDNGASLTPTSFVQLGAITRWYESFMSKIRNRGIEFLEKEE